jgi:hypothetical protein
MSIPTVFAPIKPDDFTLRPVTVHKRIVVSSANLTDTGSGYSLVQGLHAKSTTPIGSNIANNDPTNSFDGSYQHVIWKSYDHRYYRNGYDSHATFEHANRRYTWKFLNYSCSVLSIPYMDYGESIRPGSLHVSNSTHAIYLKDDGNGNIYSNADSLWVSGMRTYVPTYNVIAYWGFNNEFRRFRYRDGRVDQGRLDYESHLFEPDEKSYIKNIGFTRGANSNGMKANFYGDSYIITHNRPEFSPDKNENISLHFWLRAPVSQSNQDTPYNTIISKRGVIRRDKYGLSDKYNQNDLLIQTKHISSSVEDVLTDVYPYDIEFINSTAPGSGKIRVRRSNGITVTELTSSQAITVGADNSVAVRIGGGTMSIYINGNPRGTKSYNNDDDVFNNHSIVFGSLDRNGTQGLSGSLDEVRFYDTLIGTSSMTSLGNTVAYRTGMFQTPVVGNVFYRSGEIVISPLVKEYMNTFKGTWNISFESTHTIYQYEVLCRVKKGSFNLTYNPSARKSFKSDLLIDDMTGSLLLPYATSIGLYNSTGDLVAVGKLGQPIQMREDVDLNFRVVWDA